MGFQQKISYKQVILTYRGALGATKLLVLDTMSLRSIPWKTEGFSHIIVKLCGRKYEVEKSSTDPMVLITTAFAILLAFLLL